MCISRVRASEKLRVTQGPQVRAEVLEHITLENALSPALGPPVHFIAFLCTCKHVYHAISRARSNLNDLYTKIFLPMFGVGAVRRKFGTSTIHSRFLASHYSKLVIPLRRQVL